MSDENDERRPQTLSDYAQDPESAEHLSELLENLRKLARAVGSREVIESLSESFALMASPRDRKHYDDLRAELIAYLQQLDLPPDGQGAARPEFVASPDVSPAQIDGLAGRLLSEAGDPDPS